MCNYIHIEGQLIGMQSIEKQPLPARKPNECKDE